MKHISAPVVLSFFALLAAPAAPASAQPFQPVLQGGAAPDDASIDALFDQVEREMDARGIDTLDDIGTPPGGALAVWPDLTADATLPPIRDVDVLPDRALRLLVQPLKHTVVMLRPDERIVDIVVGDPVYFEVAGADNVAFVKPIQLNRRTLVTLTTQLDRTYAFDVFATDAHRPDEVVRVLWPLPVAEGSGDGFLGGGLVPGFAERRLTLDFVPARRLSALRAELASLAEQQAAVEQASARQLASAELLVANRRAEFFRTFPRRIEARYRLSPEVQSPPLSIHQMFSDGQFTYVRSSAQEAPALFTLGGANGSEPALVNVTLSPDGFYVIDHVVAAGYAQLHGSRGEWHVWDIPPMSLLPEVVSAGLPDRGLPPRWIRAGQARSWSARHPRLLRAVLLGAVAGTVTILALS